MGFGVLEEGFRGPLGLDRVLEGFLGVLKEVGGGILGVLKRVRGNLGGS